MSPHTFWCQLATALVDNSWDETGVRRSPSSSENASISIVLGQPRSGTDVHLTPIKRRRRTKTGILRGARMQNKCKLCPKKTKWICSKFLDNGRGQVLLCHSQTQRNCFERHFD